MNGGVLRFTTAGSVDDGKSTLIGRLLVDTRGAFSDQIDAARRENERKGGHGIDLALLTDGLKAEREQGITIDVAYRYFSTPKRKFIIADAPGHEQYTRNMVTAASTADAAVVLLDVRHGLTSQSRRHLCITHLLGIPQIVVVVNKMDLVDYDQAAFENVSNACTEFLRRLGHHDALCLPASSLAGDMIVERGSRMPWYSGPALLETLESLKARDAVLSRPFRLPVQMISRPVVSEIPDFRGYMGRVLSGRVAVGDPIMTLPDELQANVTGILGPGGFQPNAVAGDSITLTLDCDLDIPRGHLIAGKGGEVIPRSEFEATICWMGERPLKLGHRYVLRHTTNKTRAVVSRINYRLETDSLDRVEADGVRKNTIASVTLKTLHPVLCEPYLEDRGMGAFILVDQDNHTAAAGMVL